HRVGGGRRFDDERFGRHDQRVGGDARRGGHDQEPIGRRDEKRVGHRDEERRLRRGHERRIRRQNDRRLADFQKRRVRRRYQRRGLHARRLTKEREHFLVGQRAGVAEKNRRAVSRRPPRQVRVVVGAP